MDAVPRRWPPAHSQKSKGVRLSGAPPPHQANRLRAARAAAAAKRKSTRAARGVIGTRKRAAIKGDVTGVVVSPVKGAHEPAATTVQQASNASNYASVAK